MAINVRRYFLLVLILALVGLAVLLTGADSRYRQLDLALQVVAHLKMRFVEPVSAGNLLRAYMRTGTIPGMLATLNDPYTRYLQPNEYRELKIQTDGSFGGIGVILSYKEKSVIIMKALDGSPGMKAGLRQGDRIVKIKGRPTSAMTENEAVSLIRGPEGTRVTLTISRGEGKEARIFDVTITRARISLPSVEWEIIEDPVAGRIALIGIDQFAEHTANELEAALTAAERRGIRGIILDLRYNPGGLLDSAIDVSSKFLEDGVVMYMLKRDGRRLPYYVRRSGSARKYPLVILVNEWSASASEIVAGALKDRGVATLVGVKTYGKGVVQEIIPVSGGAALSVTVARYLTAGGRSIDKIGIAPDVLAGNPIKNVDLLEMQAVEKVQRQKALDIIRTKLARPLAEAS